MESIQFYKILIYKKRWIDLLPRSMLYVSSGLGKEGAKRTETLPTSLEAHSSMGNRLEDTASQYRNREINQC